MNDLIKHTMNTVYDEKMQAGAVTTFLLSFFKNIIVSDSTTIDVDIIRDSRTIAADVLRGGGTGNKNVVGKFSAKEYEVPLYWEEGPITASMMNKRLPGVDPYTETGKMAVFVYWASKLMVDSTNKILRAMEKMAGEALQFGTVTLTNSDSLDFKKKTTHSVTPSVKWSADAGAPFADIEALADVVYQDGKVRPDTLVFGADAWSAFIANTNVSTVLDNRRIDVGNLAPGEVIDGARSWGAINIGAYKFVIYIYDEFYDVEGVHTPYMVQDSVIMLNKDARLTRGFGAVEVLPQSEAEYSSLGMPAAPSLVAGQFTPFAYNLPPSALMAGVQSAPVVIPTAIDTIGTLILVDL